MSYKSFSTKSSTALTDMSQNSCLSAKLRRLKIQESLLLQNIKTHFPLDNERPIEIIDWDNVPYYTFISELKKTYIGLKNLFDEVKGDTESQETLKVADIDDIKNNVFELENNIRSFKQHVQSELAKFKSAEINLVEAIHEKSAINVRKQTKKHATPYYEIVPSPVRVLMNSPFKCTEVQQFQEYLMNSQSRYGGWNEFYHNIFAKTWHAYFSSTSSENHEGNVDDPNKINLFLEELLHKLQGFTDEEILSHSKWYSKYIYLKEHQQRAIDKWKSNRMKLKMKPLKDKTTNGFSKKKVDSAGFNYDVRSNSTNNIVSDELTHIHLESSDQVVKSFNDTHNENEIYDMNKTDRIEVKNLDLGRGIQFLKPTEQWKNRCRNEFKVSPMWNNDLGNIKKLCKPNWRLGL